LPAGCGGCGNWWLFVSGSGLRVWLLVLFVSVGASSVVFVRVVSNCLFVVLWLCVRVVFSQGTRVEAILGLPQPFGGSLLCFLVCFVCACFVVFPF